jgi:hypothetical protein
MELCFDVGVESFSIPFDSLERLDLFTVRFKNQEELVDSIIYLFGLHINIENVKNVDVRNIFTGTKKYCVKYAGDNYNILSLMEGFGKYLMKDQRRLNGYAIKNVVRAVDPRFYPGYFEERRIGLVVRRYLGHDYKKIRDTYFLIKDEVYVEIDECNLRTECMKRERISKMYSTDDDYLQWLLESSSKDENEMIMDEIAMMGIDVLDKKLKGSPIGIIDGMMPYYDAVYDDDLECLEFLTGKNLGELKKMIRPGVLRKIRK